MKRRYGLLVLALLMVFALELGRITPDLWLFGLLVTESLAATEGEYTYTVSNNEAAIVQYDGVGGNLVIPDTLGGYAVTAIEYGAFYRCQDLTGVSLPDGLLRLEDSAFGFCENLTSVNIPVGMNQGEGDYYKPFLGCQKLNDVTFHENITKIPSGLFQNCTGLQTIVIPHTVESIGDFAFSGCRRLNSITIPESVTNIGTYAFSHCTALVNVSLPDGLVRLGSNAFGDCSGLEWVNIPAGMNQGGSNHYSPFKYCERLNQITFGEGITRIPNHLFDQCTGLRAIVLPSTIAEIGDFAFANCPWLEEVVIPEGMMKIGRYAFVGGVSLDSLAIPESVTSIDGNAFNGCTGLVTVSLPSGLTQLGDYAFTNCSGLVSVNIPVGMNQGEVDRYWPFSGCESLASVSFDMGIEKIPNYLFDNCMGLQNITIPPTVKAIGDSAFKDCINLVDVVLQEPLAIIGDDAFRNCGSLENITIPDTVYSIGEGAFDNCPELTVHCGESSHALVYVVDNDIPYESSNTGDSAGQDVQISDCRNTGAITGTRQYTGGITGLAEKAMIRSVVSKGLVIGRSDYTGGIVGRMNDSTVSEGDIQESITGGSYTGGVAGYSQGGRITGVMVWGNVSSSAYTGGIVGFAEQTTIQTVENNGNVIGTDYYTGGIVGRGTNTDIEDGKVSGTVTGTSYVGGAVGCSINSKMIEVKVWGDVNGRSSYIGGITGYFMSNAEDMPGLIEGCLVSGNMGVYNAAGIVGYSSTSSNGRLIIRDTFYDGDVIHNTSARIFINTIATGLIIENSGYYIKGTVQPDTAGIYIDDVVCDEDMIERSGNFFKVKVSVSLTEGGLVINNVFESIKLFQSGYTVKSLYFSENNEREKYTLNFGNIILEENNVGASIGGMGTVESPFLIETAEQMEYIRDIMVFGGIMKGIPSQTAHYKLGGDIDLSGKTDFYGLGTKRYAFGGGFDGSGHSIRLNVVSTMENNVGLFRYTDGSKISRVTVTGKIQCRDNVGGIVGVAKNTEITGCINEAAMEVCEDNSSSHKGGIVGYAEKDVHITDCKNTGTVTGTTYTGGIAGYMGQETQITDCINNGATTGMNNYTGGIVGCAEGTIIRGTSNHGMVIGRDYYTGGIAGQITASNILECTVQGTLRGSRYVGGAAGCSINSRIANVTVYGDVDGSYAYTGGIVGYFNSNAECDTLLTEKVSH